MGNGERRGGPGGSSGGGSAAAKTKQLGFYDKGSSEELETARREATLKSGRTWASREDQLSLHRREKRISR